MDQLAESTDATQTIEGQSRLPASFRSFHPGNANKINGLLAHYRYFLLTKSGASKFASVRISDTDFLTVANLDPRRRIIASMGKSILRATIKVRFPDT